MTQELDIIRTLWPVGVVFVGFIIWLIRQEQALRQERSARMAADARIEEKFNTYNDHHKERSEMLSRDFNDIKNSQGKMLETLHNVELGVTALREYRNGQDDAKRTQRRK